MWQAGRQAGLWQSSCPSVRLIMQEAQQARLPLPGGRAVPACSPYHMAPAPSARSSPPLLLSSAPHHTTPPRPLFLFISRPLLFPFLSLSLSLSLPLFLFLSLFLPLPLFLFISLSLFLFPFLQIGRASCRERVYI